MTTDGATVRLELRVAADGLAEAAAACAPFAAAIDATGLELAPAEEPGAFRARLSAPLRTPDDRHLTARLGEVGVVTGVALGPVRTGPPEDDTLDDDPDEVFEDARLGFIEVMAPELATRIGVIAELTGLEIGEAGAELARLLSGLAERLTGLKPLPDDVILQAEGGTGDHVHAAVILAESDQDPAAAVRAVVAAIGGDGWVSGSLHPLEFAWREWPGPQIVRLEVRAGPAIGLVPDD